MLVRTHLNRNTDESRLDRLRFDATMAADLMGSEVWSWLKESLELRASKLEALIIDDVQPLDGRALDIARGSAKAFRTVVERMVEGRIGDYERAVQQLNPGDTR